MLAEIEIRETIARLCGFYPRSAPSSSDNAVLIAWLEHFEQFKPLSMANLREAIRVYTNDPAHEFFPAPAQISRLARDHWNDRYQRCPDDRPDVAALYAAGLSLETARKAILGGQARALPGGGS